MYRLHERVAWDTPRITTDPPTIHDVAVLRAESRNGRRYALDALRDAVSRYDGVPVYIDHVQSADAPRSYRDQVGWLERPRLDDDTIRADLRLNPHHPETPRILWDAQHHPQALGLSHDAVGRVTRTTDGVLVEHIESIRSVDLVTEPATVTSLFEAVMPEPTPSSAPDPLDALYQQLTLDDLSTKRPDLVDQLKQQVSQALAEELAKWRSLTEELQVKLDETRAKLEELQIEREVEQAGIAAQEGLVRSLIKLPVDDRRRIIESMRAVQTDPRITRPVVSRPVDVTSFVAAIRG